MCSEHSKRNKDEHLHENLQPKALVGSKGYYTVVSINIRVNRMAGRADGNIGKYTRLLSVGQTKINVQGNATNITKHEAVQHHSVCKLHA
jgi:hypothetical protein